jgi:t-SNARE complex subunit (syntaxin)
MNAAALESARRAKDATRSLERGMLSLNQIFLDMANLVTTQVRLGRVLYTGSHTIAFAL